MFVRQFINWEEGVLSWLLSASCDYNKAREKYFKNNKAINYGNEKAISISKIVIWKFGLIKTLTLYAKIKSSYLPPPPYNPEKCILPYFILILFRLLTLICLHPISMNWCIWLKFKVFHQAMHIFLHISWLVRHTVQIHAIRPRPQRKSVHFRV